MSTERGPADHGTEFGLGADLSARLRDAAGAEPDLTTARSALGRRVTRARRRRAAAVTGSAGLSVLLLGAVVVMNSADPTGRVTSADAPSAPVVTSTGDTDAPSTTTSVTTTPVTAPSSVTVSTTASTTVPGSSPDDSTTLFDLTAASNETYAVAGIGGSIDVEVVDGVLSLAGLPVASDGFRAVVTRNEPNRIEITFTAPTHRTRLTIRLDGTRLRADRTEETRPAPTAVTVPAPGNSTPGNSAPGNSAPGNSTPGNSTPGNSAPGNSAPGNSAPGNSAPDDSAPDDSDEPDDPDDDPNDDPDDSADDSSGSGSGGSGSSGSGSGG